MPVAKSDTVLKPGVNMANTLYNDANVQLGKIENDIRNLDAERTGRQQAYDKAVAKLLEDLNAADTEADKTLADLTKSRKMVLASIEAFGPPAPPAE